jgi:hypothetical protein
MTKSTGRGPGSTLVVSEVRNGATQAAGPARVGSGTSQRPVRPGPRDPTPGKEEMTTVTSQNSLVGTTTFGSSPELENLKLPDGRRCGDLPHGTLYGELSRLIGPGFDYHWGKYEALAAYSRFLEKIAQEAGQAAVSAYLETNK